VVRKEAVAAKLNGCKCGEDFVRATLFAFPPGVISAILWATYTGWLTLRARPATVFFEDAGMDRGCDGDPALSGNLVGGR